MAFSCYLKIEGVDGECSVTGFEDHIELLSFNHAVMQEPSGTVSDARGLSSGRADFSDFSAVKRIDKTSPTLYLKCATGEKINKVELKVAEATGEQSVWLHVTMEGVIITSMSPGGSAGGDEPLDSATFRCEKYTWEYTVPGGGGSVVTTFDCRQQG